MESTASGVYNCVMTIRPLLFDGYRFLARSDSLLFSLDVIVSTPFPVFVGSTFQDLQSYRTAVRQALHELEAVVRGMEYFGSLPDTPKEECLRIVRSCRAYVGIFAMRYGSIDEATGKSLTHLEYEEA